MAFLTFKQIFRIFFEFLAALPRTPPGLCTPLVTEPTLLSPSETNSWLRLQGSCVLIADIDDFDWQLQRSVARNAKRSSLVHAVDASIEILCSITIVLCLSLLQSGCLSSNMMSTVDHMNQVYCANVYDEATQIAGDGFPQRQRDLFMEQGTFKGVLAEL